MTQVPRPAPNHLWLENKMSRSAELFRFIEQLRFTDLIDFITVWAIIYGLLKLVRGTRAVQMAVGLLGVGLLYQLSVILGLETLQFVMRNTLLYFGFAILVIFAPEIRSALMRVGSNIRRPFGRSSRQETFEEILLAATTLSSRKIGALIVLERNVGLQNYIDTGVELEARLSYDLLVTVFDPHTPLHDGAAIIRNYKTVAAASCFLPLTLNPRLSKELGTRHRAAIGLTDETDAVVIVISEEEGSISLVVGGKMTRDLDAGTLRSAVQRLLAP